MVVRSAKSGEVEVNFKNLMGCFAFFEWTRKLIMGIGQCIVVLPHINVGNLFQTNYRGWGLGNLELSKIRNLGEGDRYIFPCSPYFPNIIKVVQIVKWSCIEINRFPIHHGGFGGEYVEEQCGKEASVLVDGSEKENVSPEVSSVSVF